MTTSLLRHTRPENTRKRLPTETIPHPQGTRDDHEHHDGEANEQGEGHAHVDLLAPLAGPVRHAASLALALLAVAREAHGLALGRGHLVALVVAGGPLVAAVAVARARVRRV